jgi:site-specific DNA-methyltransferase (adenine-specific)
MINLHHTDCMEFMRGLPDKAYSLAIVDPPYGIGVGKMFIAKDRKDPRNGRVIKCKRTKRGEWDNERPPLEYFTELRRVSCSQIIWGGNYFADILPASMGWVVWDKVNGESDQADCELAWTSYDNAVRQLRFMWHIAQGISAERGHIAQGNISLRESRIHPTQKPVALYRWLLKNYAKPGQKILDTHGGSMSIAIACDIEGYDLDLCELDPDYFAAGKKRLEAHQAAPRLFDAQKHEQPIQLTIE